MPHRPGNIGHDVETEEKIRELGPTRYATIVQFYVEKHNGDLEVQEVQQNRAVKLSQIPYINDADRKLFWMPVDEDKRNALHFTFPYGPKDIKYGANALEYSEVMRPSRKPLLRSKFPKNRTVAFTCVIADKESHGFVSCEDQLATLYAMAEQDKDLTFTHGGIALPFHVRMTGLTVTAKERRPSGLITQATIQMNLKESISINQEIVFMTAVPHEPKIITAATNPGGRPEGENWVEQSGSAAAGGNTLDPGQRASQQSEWMRQQVEKGKIVPLETGSNVGRFTEPGHPFLNTSDFYYLGDTSKLLNADGENVVPENPRWSGGPLVSSGYHG